MRNYTLDQLMKKHGTLVITKADDGSGFNVESAYAIPNTSTFQSTEWLGHGSTPAAALFNAFTHEGEKNATR